MGSRRRHSENPGHEPPSEPPSSHDALHKTLRKLAAGDFALEPSDLVGVSPETAELLDALTSRIRRLEADALEKRRLESGFDQIVEALSSLAALRFDKTLQRTYANDQFDVLAFLLNETAAEVRSLLDELTSVQTQLVHSQKMEALGMLAGGVAHDFNNMLTVLMSVNESITADLPVGHPIHAKVADASAVCERAKALTSQLLTFSRRGRTEPRDVVVADIVSKARPLLVGLAGDEVAFEVDVDSQWSVQMDPSQLEQVLMNLVVNARQAIERTGSIGVAVSDTRDVVGVPGIDGECVVIAVSDDGCGMDERTVARVFEPFFTTRADDGGTGLGLATSYGIVTGVGGAIRIASEVGEGTTMRVWLPRVTSSARRAPPPPETEKSGRTTTVLVVDDEAIVRRSVSRSLRSAGYAVHEASSGREAIELAEGARIDALVTDVVMPAMTGLELARALWSEEPALPVLFMSGFPRDVSVDDLSGPARRFLSKPFGRDELTRALEALLAGMDSVHDV